MPLHGFSSEEYEVDESRGDLVSKAALFLMHTCTCSMKLAIFAMRSELSDMWESGLAPPEESVVPPLIGCCGSLLRGCCC